MRLFSTRAVVKMAMRLEVVLKFIWQVDDVEIHVEDRRRLFED